MHDAIKNGQTIHSLTHSYTEGMAYLELVPKLVKKVLGEKMYQNFIVECNDKHASFKNFEEFVTAPIPEGMGTTVNQLRQACRLIKNPEQQH